MAPYGARWMCSSLGTSDGSKVRASSPPIRRTSSLHPKSKGSTVWKGSLSVEALIRGQFVSSGHAEGRALLALLLPLQRKAQDVVSWDFPRRADRPRAVATFGCPTIARSGSGSVAQARRVAASWVGSRIKK
jgi:hypothetical protein